MPRSDDGEDSVQLFSIGTRVVVKDALSPCEYISGIVSSRPKPPDDPKSKDFLYEILVDFSDDILFGEQTYKRIFVPSSCLVLV